MYVWYKIRDLWYHYSAGTVVELRILLQTTVLRGYQGATLCVQELMPVVTIILLLCFVRDIETGPMAAIMALMLLISRPSVGLKRMSAIVCSEKTMVVFIWGIVIAYIGDGIFTGAKVVVSIPSLRELMPYLRQIVYGLLLVPYGIFAFSPLAVIPGLWLLDAAPSIIGYWHALGEALRALMRSWLFFVGVYCMLLSALLFLIDLLQYLFPLQLSRCFAALIIAPWYGAVVVSWYICVRYR